MTIRPLVGLCFLLSACAAQPQIPSYQPEGTAQIDTQIAAQQVQLQKTEQEIAQLSAPPQIAPETLASAQHDAQKPILCSSDCADKWALAQQWIADNSHWRIQTITDSLITTYGPEDGNSLPAYTVKRIPIDGKSYQITFDVICPMDSGNPPQCSEAAPLVVLQRGSFESALNQR